MTFRLAVWAKIGKDSLFNTRWTKLQLTSRMGKKLKHPTVKEIFKGTGGVRLF